MFLEMNENVRNCKESSVFNGLGHMNTGERFMPRTRLKLMSIVHLTLSAFFIVLRFSIALRVQYMDVPLGAQST